MSPSFPRQRPAANPLQPTFRITVTTSTIVGGIVGIAHHRPLRSWSCSAPFGAASAGDRQKMADNVHRGARAS